VERFSLEHVSSAIFGKLKADAETYLSCPIMRAVITVLAIFNASPRHATGNAGKIAGLEVRRIINEPSATSLICGLDKKDEKIAIDDLGGRTFDISIQEIGDGVFDRRGRLG
jgi:molecular chaperone DnaK